MKKNLSTRIEALVNITDENYEEIWDLCCDHGIIGISYANLHKPQKIYFIDQVEGIIDKLVLHLPSAISEETTFVATCMPAEKIRINENTKNLVIMAGVGTETIIKTLKNLKAQNLKNTHFLLSTHKHPQKLRKFLIDENFSLIKEKLIYEGRHFYEMLLIDSEKNNEISLVGDQMWDFHDKKHLEYCDQLINYYEIKLRHDRIEVQNLFDQLVKIKQMFT